MSWWDDPKYDLTGRRFGRLVAQYRLDTKGPKYWLCRCDCGNTSKVSAHNLKGGQVVSCGCALQGCNKKRPYEWLYNTLKLTGKEVNLSYEQFLEFTNILTCHYCDALITWEPHSADSEYRSRAYNLDRVDNDKGYSKENCVVCCARCNRSKADRFTYREWLEIGRVIRGWTS
jgi:hypothetical protein